MIHGENLSVADGAKGLPTSRPPARDGEQRNLQQEAVGNEGDGAGVRFLNETIEDPHGAPLNLVP
jgi:hypothetical protein